MKSRFAALKFIEVAFALTTGGCMLGPAYHQPPTKVAVKWQEAANPAVDSSSDQYRDWWNVFNDPVLLRLIELAYEQNLTLRTAGVRVLEARAQLGIAIGEIYPQQQLSLVKTLSA
jgi:outer membrane protein TolC